MESERLMAKWAGRKGWDELMQRMLTFRFLDELGPEVLNLFDRFLATSAQEFEEFMNDAKRLWEEDDTEEE